MKIEKIISLANKNSEIRFLAMVRSLRAVGCDLPVWVIPYDDNKFDLPENCIWWEIEEVTSWLTANNAHKMMRKYQCLLTGNYQYADSDIVFLRNPQDVLKDVSGFITSCGHWHNPGQTCIDATAKFYKDKSTTWQKNVFNAGQYACDATLHTFETLKKTVENPLYKDACLNYKTYDQVALNLLIFLSGVPVTNLTLPPNNMESTWAGDYLTEDYARYWTDETKKPYLIHWAGFNMNIERPIHELFINYLTDGEKALWYERLKDPKNKKSAYKRLRWKLSLLKQAVKMFRGK